MRVLYLFIKKEFLVKHEPRVRATKQTSRQKNQADISCSRLLSKSNKRVYVNGGWEYFALQRMWPSLPNIATCIRGYKESQPFSKTRV